jgi:hypothetical protein
MKEKFFSEYRAKDYRMARSMREAYGYEPVLYVHEEKGALAKLWERVFNKLMGVK